MADSISDMLIRLKNANRAGKPSVLVPFSNFKFAIAELLAREGFVEGVVKKGRKARKFIEVALRYDNGAVPHITDVKRISKPSRRIYYQAQDIYAPRRGYGRLILSTPKGVLTDKEARRNQVGGEALFSIW